MLSNNGQLFSVSALFVPAAAATDVFTISPGAAQKRLSILAVTLSMVATAAAAVPFSLIKRNTLDNGGTSTSPNPVAIDNGALSAVAFGQTQAPGPISQAAIGAFTANPAALGTTTVPYGTLYQGFLNAGTLTAPGPQFALALPVTVPLVCVLRLATDQFCINLQGGTFAGNQLAVTVVFGEDFTTT